MYIFDYLCVGICVFHAFLEIVVSIVSRKKIQKICDKCFLPVVEGSNHICSDLTSSLLSTMSESDLQIISKFVNYLKKGDLDG